MKFKINPRPPIFCILLFCMLPFYGCSRYTGTPATQNRSVRSDRSVIQRGNLQNDSRPLLAVSILPQQYFATRIGGDRIRTLVLAGPGQNPHDYEPNPGQLQSLAGADAWVLSGTEFEITFAPKVQKLFPSLDVVDGTAGIHFRESQETDEDSAGETAAGVSGNELDRIDRHTWLGSEGAQIMASHIRDTLCRLDSANAVFYNENYNALITDIQQEFSRLATELEGLRGKTILVYHPAFGYFLDEFGIIQEAVETGGKEPTPRQLADIITQARNENIKVIFVQAQFPAQSAAAVASAVGAKLEILDPLAPDWLENIRYIGETLKQAIE
ncbi:MAG: zinc ABC transporter substrate-binding protein [Treponema sp.]|nr:zinc ABC transporter substrate-binding protein [Treponema sp.]